MLAPPRSSNWRAHLLNLNFNYHDADTQLTTACNHNNQRRPSRWAPATATCSLVVLALFLSLASPALQIRVASAQMVAVPGGGGGGGISSSELPAEARSESPQRPPAPLGAQSLTPQAANTLYKLINFIQSQNGRNGLGQPTGARPPSQPSQPTNPNQRLAPPQQVGANLFPGGQQSNNFQPTLPFNAQQAANQRNRQVGVSFPNDRRQPQPQPQQQPPSIPLNSMGQRGAPMPSPNQVMLMATPSRLPVRPQQQSGGAQQVFLRPPQVGANSQTTGFVPARGPQVPTGSAISVVQAPPTPGEPTDGSPVSNNPPNATTEPTTTTTTTTTTSTAATTTTTTTGAPTNTTRRPSATTLLAGSPDIVTVPPDYNPDAPNQQVPQNFEISVSAQMGGGPGAGEPKPMPPLEQVGITSATPSLPIGQPSASTTTIFWSPPETSTASSSSTGDLLLITPTSSSQQQPQQTVAPPEVPAIIATKTSDSQVQPTSAPPSRVRDTSEVGVTPPEGVVYGRPSSQGDESKPSGPPAASTPTAGKPFIQAVQMDSQVRPFAQATGGGSAPPPLQQRPQLRSSRPGMQVGSGFNIAPVPGGGSGMPSGDINDFLRAEAVAAAALAGGGGGGHLDTPPAHNDTTSSGGGGGLPPVPPTRSSRRPTFKPRPAVPPIRIDSCIVGDDNSCDQSQNERCVTEYGISSCHCRPGFARLSQMRGFCSPVAQLQVALRLERLADNRKLAFNSSLENPNSEEYQLLEFETVQAVGAAFGQSSSLAKQFMGARLNRFFERRGRVHANLTVALELAGADPTRMQSVVGQELARVAQQVASSNRSAGVLGDSLVVVDGLRDTFAKLQDLNECASRELNDCSVHATCHNNFGGFTCQCLAGYEDKHLLAGSNSSESATNNNNNNNNHRQGRICVGCSANFCSGRGECYIADGEKRCRCRANFLGARCDIDSEVLAVALGGSLIGLVILVVTFWCLFALNKRWKREQQRLDSFSATSGLTFNYVTSHQQQQQQHQSASPRRHSRAPQPIRNGGRSISHSIQPHHHHSHAHYAAPSDQQAIMGTGSTSSSGSSLMAAAAAAATSQPIACNPYAPNFRYDADLLIGPASSGSSSDQMSPDYGGGYLGAGSQHQVDSYTLSGLHHMQAAAHYGLHYNTAGKQHTGNNNNHHHHHHHRSSEFNPAAAAASANRSLLQHPDNKQQPLIGYYLMR